MFVAWGGTTNAVEHQTRERQVQEQVRTQQGQNEHPTSVLPFHLKGPITGLGDRWEESTKVSGNKLPRGVHVRFSVGAREKAIPRAKRQATHTHTHVFSIMMPQ